MTFDLLTDQYWERNTLYNFDYSLRVNMNKFNWKEQKWILRISLGT